MEKTTWIVLFFVVLFAGTSFAQDKVSFYNNQPSDFQFKMDKALNININNGDVKQHIVSVANDRIDMVYLTEFIGLLSDDVTSGDEKDNKVSDDVVLDDGTKGCSATVFGPLMGLTLLPLLLFKRKNK